MQPGAEALTEEEFARQFEPREGVAYGWVVQYAKDDFARALDLFRRLDDKAAALVNYLGAGTGLLMFGAVNGLSAGALDKWIALAAVPSFVLAAVALVCATASRLAASRPGPPEPLAALRYAEYYNERAEAAFVAAWRRASAGAYRAAEDKARTLNRATRCFIAAVLALALPLGVALTQKFAA